MKIQELLETKLGKTVKEASNAEVYYALLHVVQNMAKDKEVPVKKKKIYYISAEFLIGKLLSNNLINLGLYDEVKEVLAANGKDAVTTRNGSIEPDAFSGKTVKDIKTVYGEDNTPSMYIINYEGGGFVIVGATKNYYPILAYSDTNSINIEKAKQSGFSIWMDETNWAIKESDMQNAETLANMRSMWEAYEILPQHVMLLLIIIVMGQCFVKG